MTRDSFSSFPFGASPSSDAYRQNCKEKKDNEESQRGTFHGVMSFLLRCNVRPREGNSLQFERAAYSYTPRSGQTMALLYFDERLKQVKPTKTQFLTANNDCTVIALAAAHLHLVNTPSPVSPVWRVSSPSSHQDSRLLYYRQHSCAECRPLRSDIPPRSRPRRRAWRRSLHSRP